jgi:hypothetical protein
MFHDRVYPFAFEQQNLINSTNFTLLGQQQVQSYLVL